jgi:hypothetical protein
MEEKLKIEREKEERIRGGIPLAALKEKEKFEVQGPGFHFPLIIGRQFSRSPQRQ